MNIPSSTKETGLQGLKAVGELNGFGSASIVVLGTSVGNLNTDIVDLMRGKATGDSALISSPQTIRLTQPERQE